MLSKKDDEVVALRMELQEVKVWLGGRRKGKCPPSYPHDPFSLGIPNDNGLASHALFLVKV